MSTTYTKSVATDFSGNINHGQLHTDIDNDSVITKQLKSISVIGDVVSIIFIEALTTPESTQLDNLCSGHVPVEEEIIPSEIFSINPKKDSYKSKNWEKLGTIHYRGEKIDGSIKKAVVSGYMDSGTTSYDIRIYDKTNAKTLGSVTGTSTTEETLEITSMVNMPQEPAKIQIQGKQNSGKNKKYYIDTVQFYI
jgi:hypothetical protein